MAKLKRVMQLIEDHGISDAELGTYLIKQYMSEEEAVRAVVTFLKAEKNVQVEDVILQGEHFRWTDDNDDIVYYAQKINEFTITGHSVNTKFKVVHLPKEECIKVYDYE